MTILVYLCMGLASYSVTEAKSINIKIDSDDVVKIMGSFMNSETFKNFATQVLQRSMAKQLGYSNPFHPEDDLVTTFDTAVKQEYEKLKQKKKPKISTKIDILDKENENFADDILSDDIFSDNEVDRISVHKPNNITSLMQHAPITVKPSKNHILSNKINNVLVNGKIISRKDGLHGMLDQSDRANFKPIQKRFQMEGRKDIDVKELNF